MNNHANFFANQASDYLRFRPTYPDALFEWIAQHCSEHGTVWDCACGSGQASAKLAFYFDRVIATDAQKNQLKHATIHKKITYQLSPASHTTLPSRSVDCVTIAQALHWFANDDFFQEVKRVCKPGTPVAAWCYPLLTVDDPSINAILHDFYASTTKPYWAKERRYIDDRYNTIPFDFKERQTASFWCEARWNLEHLIGYVSTWSAVQAYKEVRHHDPVKAIFQPAVQKAWSNPHDLKTIKFEIICLLGRV